MVLAVVVSETEQMVFVVMLHADLALVKLASRVVARLTPFAAAVVVSALIHDLPLLVLADAVRLAFTVVVRAGGLGLVFSDLALGVLGADTVVVWACSHFLPLVLLAGRVGRACTVPGRSGAIVGLFPLGVSAGRCGQAAVLSRPRLVLALAIARAACREPPFLGDRASRTRAAHVNTSALLVRTWLALFAGARIHPRWGVSTWRMPMALTTEHVACLTAVLALTVLVGANRTLVTRCASLIALEVPLGALLASQTIRQLGEVALGTVSAHTVAVESRRRHLVLTWPAHAPVGASAV